MNQRFRILLGAIVLAGMAGLAGGVTPAAAESVDSLLAAHAEAMGVSRESIDPGCWRIVEEISGLGMAGRVETWAQAPASVRSRMELGPLVVETWFDGERGWLNDRNAASREAVGAELDGMLVQALFATGAWLLENPPVPLAFRLDEEASTDSTAVLSCQPLLEKPLRIELDRQSMLPLSTSYETANGEQVQYFLEWDWHDDVRVTARSRLEIANMLTLDTRLLSIERGPARSPDFFRPADLDGGPPGDVQFDAPVVSAPLLEDGLHLTIQGFVEDAVGEEVPVVLLVDTGAGANFLDSAVADRLGLEGVGEVPTLGVGGHAESSFVEVSALRIGEVRLSDQSWMASDFSQVRSWFEHPPSAVLGYDFLSRTVLEVDYEERVLRFHDPAHFESPAGAAAIPLRMDANIPSIEVLVEGHTGWVHVDTGSNGALDLAQPFVEEYELLSGREVAPAGGLSGIGGVATSWRGQVDRLEFGRIVLEEVDTGFNEAEEGLFARDDVAGILGAELLSRFRCWFDYPGQTLWLVER